MRTRTQAGLGRRRWVLFPIEAICEPGKEHQGSLTVVIHDSAARGLPSEAGVGKGVIRA